MSLDNRRNLDFAFPSFAPGLPSVYERAGFNVKHSAQSLNSGRSGSKSSLGSGTSHAPSVGAPGLPTPTSLNSHKFQEPSLPVMKRVPGSAPNLSSSVAGGLPTQPSLPSAVPSHVLPRGAPAEAPYSPQEIPPRSASRGHTLPLTTRKPSLASHESSQSSQLLSHHSLGSMLSSESSYSQSYSAGSDTTQSSTESAAAPEFQFDSYGHQNKQAQYPPSLEDEAHDQFLATPTFDKNRFSNTSSVYSSGGQRRSELRGLRDNHPTLASIPSFKDGPLCPYPNSPTPDQANTPVNQLPKMPEKAPNHAKRVSTIRESEHYTHSSSSSQSSGLITQQRNNKICRQCSQLISGKSVYSKDGIMSGRWHKHCFACTDCQSALSSEVYVLMDSPYCNACYHQANKSVCRSCGEGIEGPCLEGIGERGYVPQRYHPSCLECDLCSVKLSEIYYEAGGRTYCEMHGANAKQARRRTTRLLMNN